jgi:hypothetical protein
MSKKKKIKQTIHIWAGQKGTMCSLSHIAEKDGYVWLSKMGTKAAIQVNCKKCVEAYTKQAETSKEIIEEKIIVEVKDGVAYCDDPRVKILDHDNH